MVLLIGGAFCLIFIFIIKNDWALIVSVCLLSILLGMVRYHIADQVYLPYENYIDKKIEVEGVIVDGPDFKENNQRFVLNEGTNNTKILVSADFDTDLLYGDKVRVKGKIEKPENFETDQGKIFDYINYLRKDNIFYTISFANVEVLSHGHGNMVKSILFKVKNKFLEKINLVIRYPENLLLGGLILGEKSAFSKELRESFVNTGTIHMVALSGYNITIVAEWFMKLFSFLPKMFGIGMGMFSIVLFIVMTGGGSTGVRAGIMAFLALYTRASGRNYDVGRALLLAGVLMILINPLTLPYDVSFQLSFLATIALIFFSPKCEKYFLWVTEKFGLREIATITFAVYIFVLPFLLYKTGNLSLVALPANMLVLPLIPITMAFGFLTGFFGVISYYVSIPFAFVSSLLLKYELGVIEMFARIPFAAVIIPNFPLVITILIYAYAVYVLWGSALKDLLRIQ